MTGVHITVRPLQSGDAGCGLLETLDALRPTRDMSRQKAQRLVDAFASDENRLVAVAVLDGTIVGTITILFEKKIIHDGGVVGHIEDLAVHRDYQKSGIGGKLLQYTLDAAEARGCYKVILNCVDELVGYYEGHGFQNHSNGMRHDYGTA